MAFQRDKPFAEFLRATARSALLAESAPAANFLLEERLTEQREEDFLTRKHGDTTKPWSIESWLGTFGNHFSDKVARPLLRASEISTFTAANQENLRPHEESHQDVVRLESVRALHKRCPLDFESPAELAEELRQMIRSRPPGGAGAFGADQHGRLAAWLEEINKQRDARPAFAVPFGEVETLLAAPDWATRLRNALGLAHHAGSPAKPLPVALCRYSLKRAEKAARKAKAEGWLAIPTALEAGGELGPGSAFFPFPKAAEGANPLGFGVTVDLGMTEGGLDCKSELLHFRIDYTLEDFMMVGEITDEISDAQLSTARRRHFDLLEQDLKHRSDVP